MVTSLSVISSVTQVWVQSSAVSICCIIEQEMSFALLQSTQLNQERQMGAPVCYSVVFSRDVALKYEYILCWKMLMDHTYRYCYVSPMQFQFFSKHFFDLPPWNTINLLSSTISSMCCNSIALCFTSVDVIRLPLPMGHNSFCFSVHYEQLVVFSTGCIINCLYSQLVVFSTINLCYLNGQIRFLC